MRLVQRLRSLAVAALSYTSGKLLLPFRMLGIRDRMEV